MGHKISRLLIEGLGEKPTTPKPGPYGEALHAMSGERPTTPKPVAVKPPKPEADRSRPGRN